MFCAAAFTVIATVPNASTSDAAAAEKPKLVMPRHWALHEVLEAFTLLDSDADGKLSREELQQAVQAAKVEAHEPPTAAVAVVAASTEAVPGSLPPSLATIVSVPAMPIPGSPALVTVPLTP